MKSVRILWRFSRPHTIIGSVISIFTLYLIVCGKLETPHLPYLATALAIGISCNIFIVGINQIADIEIDKINKPELPIPSGVLSANEARLIVYAAAAISLSLSLLVSIYLFGIVAMAIFVGWAYSMPPIYLKQHHLTAALAISMVRGVLLNAGGFMVFNYLVNGSVIMPENVQILTLFIVVFSIVIAWFKDLPDIEGDRKYNVKTLAILYSPKTALIAGNLLVGAAYLFTISIKVIRFRESDPLSAQTSILLFGHILLLLLFILNALSIRTNEKAAMIAFYNRFWWFFFAEYVLYLIAYLPW